MHLRNPGVYRELAHVARDGSFLFANSSVPPATHEEAFLAGRRTDPQVFQR